MLFITLKFLFIFSLFIFYIFSGTNLNIVLFLQNLPIFLTLTYNSTYFYILYIFLTQDISLFYSVFGLLSLFNEVLSILTLLHRAFHGIFNVFSADIDLLCEADDSWLWANVLQQPNLILAFGQHINGT